MTLKILKYICALLLCASFAAHGLAQPPSRARNGASATPAPTDTARHEPAVRGIQYVPELDTTALRPLPALAGFSISVDAAGAILAAVSPYGQFEAALRANLRGRFFPIVEMGLGLSDHTDETTNIHYKTSAPFFRLGCDYNFARDLRSGNRIFGGLRYGFSSFKYDIDAPDVVDPTYGTLTPFHKEGLKGQAHWAEAVFGLEAKIWRNFHVGWSVRYRAKLSNKKSDVGEPWYVPGYGRCKNAVLAGTFNLVFDI